jgi:hypothetical protein
MMKGHLEKHQFYILAKAKINQSSIPAGIFADIAPFSNWMSIKASPL